MSRKWKRSRRGEKSTRGVGKEEKKDEERRSHGSMRLVSVDCGVSHYRPAEALGWALGGPVAGAARCGQAACLVSRP